MIPPFIRKVHTHIKRRLSPGKSQEWRMRKAVSGCRQCETKELYLRQHTRPFSVPEESHWVNYYMRLSYSKAVHSLSLCKLLEYTLKEQKSELEKPAESGVLSQLSSIYFYKEQAPVPSSFNCGNSLGPDCQNNTLSHSKTSPEGVRTFSSKLQKYAWKEIQSSLTTTQTTPLARCLNSTWLIHPREGWYYNCHQIGHKTTGKIMVCKGLVARLSGFSVTTYWIISPRKKHCCGSIQDLPLAFVFGFQASEQDGKGREWKNLRRDPSAKLVWKFQMLTERWRIVWV